MDASTFTIGDIVIIGVVLLSALLAMVRGFTREVLGLGALAAALAAAYFGFGHVSPYARQYIQPDTVADGASAVGIFLVVWFVAAMIGHWFSRKIEDSPVSAIDRTLGFVFGAVRGLAVLAVLFLVFVKLVPAPEQHPAWVRDARLLPLVAESAAFIDTLLPSEAPPLPAVPGLSPRGSGGTGTAPTTADDTEASQGYNARDRQALERALQSVTGEPDQAAPAER
ncbi:MAG: CvpA family protein [Alphaproteobacteria bacterium]|nr:CvpA family protein [Alphaproteobacteria bacterium]MDX5368999.1 CvpA family protein [Alphaproteobacteria bacterium]MDX5463699.1 CvpA family protein [Alphaproteobacteria bacterium]